MQDQTLLPVEHGGNLARAEMLFPLAPRPFVDLSTGINPHAYPLFDLPASALTRLPEPSRIAELCAFAAHNYGAKTDEIVAAPGTQILLPLVAELCAPGTAAILGPTYQEHARAAVVAGHAVREVRSFDALAEADLAVVVNPNNPDGRTISRRHLLALAAQMHAKSGLLVVDEAFMDVGPRAESVSNAAGQGGLIVLRSFGKFFGLAGARLGFAIAAPAIAARLNARLGPWAVAGPALEYGLRAYADKTWQESMRLQLAQEAQRLDSCFSRAGIAVTGGTSLFRHIAIHNAASLHRHLGEQGVLLRAFSDRPRELRCGLPGDESEWQRLEEALSAWEEKR